MTRPWLRLLPLALATLPLVAPASARAACQPDPCGSSLAFKSITPRSAALIPTDGVFLFDVELSGSDDFIFPEQLASVELEVTIEDVPVAGAIEWVDLMRQTDPAAPQVLAWRPAEPLAENADYEVSGQVVNSLLGPDEQACAPASLPIDVVFTTDTQPSAPLAAPVGISDESFTVDPIADNIGSFACCAGSAPVEDECGEVTFPADRCTPFQGHGQIRVEYTVDQALPEPTAAQVVRFLDSGSEDAPLVLSASLTDTVAADWPEPVCLRLGLHNVGTGERVLADEVCHGADQPEKFGVLVIDPLVAIGASCPGEVQTCAIVDTDPPEWDDNECSPWDPGPGTTGDTGDDPTTGSAETDPTPTTGGTGDDPTTGGETTDGPQQDDDPGGCGCATSTPSPGLALLLLALPRRRARPRRK